MAFVKLDTGLVASSLWVERDQRSLFVTALLMSEPFEVAQETPQLQVRSLEPTGWKVPPGWYGLVRAAGVGIVRMDGMAREAGLDALEALGAPDPESRSQDYEGRRLVRIDGGYLVLNFMKYRDKDHTAAARQRRLRLRRKQAEVPPEQPVTPLRSATSQIAEADGRGQSTEPSSSPSSRQAELLALVPHRGAWEAEMNVALEGMHGPPLTAAQVEQACADYLGNGGAERPNLRAFRAYLRKAGEPARGGPVMTGRGTVAQRTFENGLRALGSGDD